MELKDIIKDDWKVIDDFPRYLISNRGEVFSITSNKVLRVGINGLVRSFHIRRYAVRGQWQNALYSKNVRNPSK